MTSRSPAAVLTILLAATPAAAIDPAEQHSQTLRGTETGWLALLPHWVLDLIGQSSVAAEDTPTLDSPAPQNSGEPPANTETDDGPDWDPNG